MTQKYISQSWTQWVAGCIVTPSTFLQYFPSIMKKDSNGADSNTNKDLKGFLEKLLTIVFYGKVCQQKFR